MTVHEYFELDESVTSIYKYAPVYGHTLNGNKVVIKRTKSQDERLDNLFSWQKHLNHNDIASVKPVEFKSKVYHKIGEENWIVYPFIEGQAYSGSEDQIFKAGDLLGRIHKASTGIFDHGFKWDNYDDEFYEDVAADLEGIEANYTDLFKTAACQTLHAKLHELRTSKCAHLKQIDIPTVDSTWDYKASNIIYSNQGPVLIDTDNAGRVPRIFDLALALLLFHTEVQDAPGRVFTTEEWNVFYRAYSEHIELTEKEKEVWQDYLLFVYMDEVLWAISDLEEDEPERQKAFMESLVLFDFEAYKL